MSHQSSSYRNSDPLLREILSDIPSAEREALVEAWNLAGDAPPVSAVTRVSNWAQIERAIGPAVAPSGSRLRLVRLPAWTQMAVAASVVLFVALGYLSRPVESAYSAGSGLAPQVVTLGDGTEVELASGTSLWVREGFGHTHRNVRMDGEAFFEVTPAVDNGGLAFRVETFNAAVEVVGTAFNVRARQSELEASTSVAVAHGLVNVEPSALPTLAVGLRPGEATTVGGNAVPGATGPVDLSRVLAWRSGGLAFDQVPMGVVFDEIERRFELRIDAPAAIERISVSYWRETSVDVEEIVSDLADVIDAQIRRTANGFEVYQADR